MCARLSAVNGVGVTSPLSFVLRPQSVCHERVGGGAHDAVITASPQIARDVVVALGMLAKDRGKDGMRTPPELIEYEAAMTYLARGALPSYRAECRGPAEVEPFSRSCSVRRAAELLGIGERRVRQLCQAKQLRSRRPGWAVEIDEASVEALMARRETVA